LDDDDRARVALVPRLLVVERVDVTAAARPRGAAVICIHAGARVVGGLPPAT
jgi:hypothetical protein